MSIFSCCKQRSGLLVLLVLALLGAGVYGGVTWYRSRPKPTQPPDMAVVHEANNRGIGLMEQLNEKSYAEAVTVFEEVVRLAPDWIPGRVNLGIALLNSGNNMPEHLARVPGVFEEVSRRDPTNRHAHFCLGLLLLHGGKAEDRNQARAHFEAVAKDDPKDPAVWYWLGETYPDDATQRLECFEKAAQLDPYMKGNMYAMCMALRQKDPHKAGVLLKQFKDFTQAEGFNPLALAYGQMGRYADVVGRSADETALAQIGPVPAFVKSETHKVTLAPTAQWVSAADLKSGPDGSLRQQIRDRFGGVIVALDYNRDGKMDFLLLGAVMEGGKIRDLLLSQEGKGQFKDVTTAAGLAKPFASLGCCVADCNNDGYPDLLLTGVAGVRLLRNTQKGGFEDITTAVGLEKLDGVCLGATFIDLDQDGDLDLVVTRYAGSREQAEASLQGSPVQGNSSLACFINVGEAPVSGAAEKLVPFQPRFRLQEGNPLGRHEHPLGLAVGDFDLDRDLDLMVLTDGQSPALVQNDRLLRFRSVILPDSLAPSGKWNGALVLDVNHDACSDLLLIGSKITPLLLLSNPGPHAGKIETSFTKVTVQAPWLMQAQAIDLDLDGWTDVVGLSSQKTPIFLHNEGGKLVRLPGAFEEDESWPFKLAGLVIADVDSNGFPDLGAWTEDKGLQFFINQGNDNHSLELELTGLRGASKAGNEKLRCTADGFGVWAAAQAGNLWTGAEKATLQAGLGQSSQPLILGLGVHDKADVVRLRWPDSVLQAELNQPTNVMVQISETSRRSGSCPVLFTWDGEKFVFVTDFLGGGALGELSASGETRMPRPEESVTIEAHQLALQNGEYILKVAEPMDEIIYLDRLQLVVVDHPKDVRVYPDERFVTSGPSPSQDLLVLGKPIMPEKVLDHRGRDVTKILRDWDRDTVDGFAKRSWLGLSEEHWVELDFGDQLDSFGKQEPLVLCLAGWTDYPYPESIWAAGQAGVSLLPPTLERFERSVSPVPASEKTVGYGARSEGWKMVGEIGFPAGLPRLMTYPLMGQLKGSSRLRLRTNLDIYWDQIYIAPLREAIPASAAGGAGQSARTTKLEVDAAVLGYGGFMRECSPDGKQPTLYDYHQLEPVLANRFTGPLTRPGKVTNLLRETDDRFAIFGPGSEVTVKFDAKELPALPAGWQRSFVLRTWGYCKDCAPFTATGGKVEPLPFRGMKTYPYEK